jgi:hypothetical protein
MFTSISTYISYIIFYIFNSIITYISNIIFYNCNSIITYTSYIIFYIRPPGISFPSDWGAEEEM